MKEMPRRGAVWVAWLAMAAATVIAPGSVSAASLDRSWGGDGTVITASGAPLVGGGVTGQPTGNAWAMERDRQGRYVVGGGAGDQLMVARYLRSGELDQSFGFGGVAKFGSVIGLSDPKHHRPIVRGIVLPNDGKILVIAEHWSMTATHASTIYPMSIRLNEDGSVDHSYGDPGYEGAWGGVPGWLTSVSINLRDVIGLPSGGFLMSGTRNRNRGVSARLVKFGPDGRIDRSFAANGTVAVNPEKWPTWSGFYEMKRLRSGKILVGGDIRNRLMVGRLTRDGKWDRRFGKGRSGKTVVQFKDTNGKPCFCSVGRGMNTDRKGRIVLAGYSFPRIEKRRSQVELDLLRFRPDGRPDRSFGRGGKVRINLGRRIDVQEVVVHPRTGRIYVSAWFGYGAPKFAVFAFKPNGKPDRSFFHKGRYVTKIGDISNAQEIQVDPQGRLIVSGGTTIDGEGAFVIKRFRVP